MPLYLWDDPDGDRFRESYLTPYPDVWRHGDFISIAADGQCVISGRSDSTLNRGGVRTGTADFYAVVEDLPEVLESIVIDTGGVDGDGRLVLLIVLSEQASLDEALTDRIRRKIRSELSPRHVPDEVHRIDAVPKTLNGKKMEVPVKRTLQGTPVDEVASRDAMANPEAMEAIVALASSRAP